MMLEDFPFELASFVRPTDPATSHAAAASRKNRIRWGSQRHLLLNEYVKGNLTDEEAGKASGLYEQRACFWKRCGELRDLGLICDSGMTRTSDSGNEVMVCSITYRGLSVLEAVEAERV
jgi:hypothetical protein